MPRGTPKRYEEEGKLQRQEDEKQIKRLLRKKNWLTWEETWWKEAWSKMKDEAIEYAKAKEKGVPAEELAAIARKYRTARMLTCQLAGVKTAEEAREHLKGILNLMEEEKLPAEWAITRVENRRKREAGYRFNGKTREWYKPKEE